MRVTANQNAYYDWNTRAESENQTERDTADSPARIQEGDLG